MSLAYFPMYPDDFEADTAHLTLAEDGAYNRLLRLCWRTPSCSIPTDMEWIYRRMRAANDADKAVIDTVLSEFFTVEKGRFFNARLLREHNASVSRHDAAVKNGKKGGRPPKSLKNNDKDESSGLANQKLKKANQNHNQNHIEKEDTNVSSQKIASRFDEFWAVYPHRGGAKRGKKPSQAKYAKAVKSGVTEQALIDGARRYCMDRQVIDGFAKDPATWLHNECWNDDIQRSIKLASTKASFGAFGHIPEVG